MTLFKDAESLSKGRKVLKVAVVGSRNYKLLGNVRETLRIVQEECEAISVRLEVISGGAKGVDRWAKKVCDELGIFIVEFKPDYDAYGGKKAPLVRNERIAMESDLMIAFYDGESRGTKHVMGRMRSMQKRVLMVV
jgi:hypothetical protein